VVFSLSPNTDSFISLTSTQFGGTWKVEGATIA
jgi:hypothetical protein